MKIEEINKVIKIGKNQEDIEITEFLNNFPVLKGNETIFTLKWSMVYKVSGSDIVHFIKGLHLIEEKYKTETNYKIGFGSPSPTFKILKKLANENFEKALEIEKWISENGGNYYIAKANSQELFKSKLL